MMLKPCWTRTRSSWLVTLCQNGFVAGALDPGIHHTENRRKRGYGSARKPILPTTCRIMQSEVRSWPSMGLVKSESPEMSWLSSKKGSSGYPDTPHEGSHASSSSSVISILIVHIMVSAQRIVHLQTGKVYLWLILYASLINTNAYLMQTGAIITGNAIACAVVTVITVLLLKVPPIPVHWKPPHFISAVKYPIEALLMNKFKGTKYVKDNTMEMEDLAQCPPVERKTSKLHNKASAAPNTKWMLIDGDILLTMDAHSFENFCINIGIVLVWWVLCRLYFCVAHRFYPETENEV